MTHRHDGEHKGLRQNCRHVHAGACRRTSLCDELLATDWLSSHSLGGPTHSPAGRSKEHSWHSSSPHLTASGQRHVRRALRGAPQDPGARRRLTDLGHHVFLCHWLHHRAHDSDYGVTSLPTATSEITHADWGAPGQAPPSAHSRTASRLSVMTTCMILASRSGPSSGARRAIVAAISASRSGSRLASSL